MARPSFPLGVAMNLNLPLEDAQSNYQWANFARWAAYSRFQTCILKGYDSEHKDRYEFRNPNSTSICDARGTLKHIRQMVEEADDLDNFRNRIEGVLIDALDLGEEQKEILNHQFRSYNRQEEQQKLVADIMSQDPATVRGNDPTLPSTLKHSRQFDALCDCTKVTALRKEVCIQPANHIIKAKMGPIKRQQARKKQNTKGAKNNGPPIRKTSPKKANTKNVSSIPTAVDPVIEQWYTDPYNRYNPDGSAGNKLRKEVLTTALRNRGFSANRILNIVNWLVRCNGRYREYDELVGVGRRRTGSNTRHRQTKNRHRNTPSKTASKQQHDDSAIETSSGAGNGEEKVKVQKANLAQPATELNTYPSPISVNHDENVETATSHNEPNNEDLAKISPDDDLFNFSGTDDAEIDEESDSPFADPAEREAIMQQLKEELTGVRPTFHSLHRPGTEEYQDDYDDWYLEELKRTQSFWNMIYGDDLDDAPEDPNLKFTYFRDPQGMPRPDVQYPSQGLKKLKMCKVQGQEVWTEDDTFGLYVPAKNERIERGRIERVGNPETEEAGV